MSKKEVMTNRTIINDSKSNVLGPKYASDSLEVRAYRIKLLIQDKQIQAHRNDRMERWIFQLADKLDIKLKYE